MLCGVCVGVGVCVVFVCVWVGVCGVCVWECDVWSVMCVCACVGGWVCVFVCVTECDQVQHATLYRSE